ncbi:hypothetical protein ZIOFF_013361 [Zingiber officinale]|uniref:Uncharacterized protein n=1 Tax=Zingiber officinale TaxID=94328 RepID=A0A8J5LU50_ZINOF|nr:hypothetical protein ZIOFF_013361 [Zingiber officinale]
MTDPRLRDMLFKMTNLSSLAGLITAAGEKLGVEKAVRQAVSKPGTECRNEACWWSTKLIFGHLQRYEKTRISIQICNGIASQTNLVELDLADIQIGPSQCPKTIWQCHFGDYLSIFGYTKHELSLRRGLQFGELGVRRTNRDNPEGTQVRIVQK